MLAGSSNARVHRLRKVFCDPMSEVYLMFYQAALQPFITVYKFLQSKDPIISVMHNQLTSFFKKLMGRFVCVSAIQAVDADITELEFSNASNQLPGIHYKSLVTSCRDHET